MMCDVGSALQGLLAEMTPDAEGYIPYQDLLKMLNGVKEFSFAWVARAAS